MELAWEAEGARRTGVAEFSFAPTAQDEEDLRRYLEDFLQYPQDPAPKPRRSFCARTLLPTFPGFP